MSNRPTDPDLPRTERLLVRGFAALAAAVWPTAAALLAAQATRSVSLTPKTFALTMCWTLGAGCLAFGISMLRNHEPWVVRALTRGFELGDPRLDDILIPVAPRWRTRASTRRLLSSAAACAWILAGIYTGQYAAGVYNVRPNVALFTLIFFLAAGIWCTVVLFALAADARRESAYDLACTLHRQRRTEQDRLAVAAEGTGPDPDGDDSDDEGDDGPLAARGCPPLHIVRDGETPNAVALLAPIAAFGAWLRSWAHLRAVAGTVAMAATVSAATAPPAIRAPYAGPRTAPPQGSPASMTPAALETGTATTAPTSIAPSYAAPRSTPNSATASAIPSQAPVVALRVTAPTATPPLLPRLPVVIKATSTPLPSPTPSICVPLITVCVGTAH